MKDPSTPRNDRTRGGNRTTMRHLPAAMAALTVLSALSCLLAKPAASAAPATSATPAASAAPATSAAPAATVREKAILTLKAREIRIGRTKGSPVLFEPGRHVKRSTYTTYIFVYDEFREKIGDPEKVDDVKVEVEILRTRERRHKPEGGASPDGGFKIIEHRCRILRVIK